MKETVRTLFSDHIELFNKPKHAWTPYEMGIVYQIYSEMLGVVKVDSGCNNCRRETLRQVRQEYLKMGS